MVTMSIEDSRMTRIVSFARSNGLKFAAEVAFNFVLPFAELDEPAGRQQPFGDQPGMSADADGGIHDHLAAHRGEQVQHFSGKHRLVARFRSGTDLTHESTSREGTAKVKEERSSPRHGTF